MRKEDVDLIVPTHNLTVDLPMSKKYVTGNWLGRFLIQRFLRTLVQLLQQMPVPPASLLDVGCGEGLISRQLRALWPQATINAVDIQMELLQVAQQLVPDAGFVAGSGYALPLPSASFDLVICTEVMEHLTTPNVALAEFVRVGKGYFLLSVPNEPWWRLANIVRGSYWTAWGNTPGHLNHWRSNQFVELLSTYMTVVAVKRPFPWTMVLCRK
jgi:2-polyprenyl-3-methyl-5-hydroxy-6-metoxy-1,4-benzoquinol methylase